MHVSLDKPQLPSTQKVKNILVRSFSTNRQEKNPYCPEACHILKYSPKYYRSLAIEIRPFSPLLSKIKKIKKLKKLEGRTGASFEEILPQNLWFNLLGNTRKEVKEPPLISPNNVMVKLSKPFWRKLNLQNLKFFPNLTSFSLASWGVDTSGSLFIRYIWNLRRLRSLEIPVWGDYSPKAKWIFERLEKMRGLLGRLESFFINIELGDVNFRELFQNKNVFSHLTILCLTGSYDPIFAEIPQACKNLKCLSLDFRRVDEESKFLDLLTSIQYFEKLRFLDFHWPREAKSSWGYFKPPSSLRKLALAFDTPHLINECLSGKNIGPNNVVEHWEEIQELDSLDFSVRCKTLEEAIFLKQFITMVLKKVRKLRMLKISMTGPIDNVEPFFVEEVPHLYETLEKFEHRFSKQSLGQESAKFDLGMMKPFRNLKELKLEGSKVTYENVEGIVTLMEENKKDSETPVLHIQIDSMFDQDQDWLGETLKKMKRIKRGEKDLEVAINLIFSTEHPVDLLEKLCSEIPAGLIRKRLIISLRILNYWDFEPLPFERVRDILKKYSQIRNLKLFLKNGSSTLGYHKLEGEQERLSIN